MVEPPPFDRIGRSRRQAVALFSSRAEAHVCIGLSAVLRERAASQWRGPAVSVAYLVISCRSANILEAATLRHGSADPIPAEDLPGCLGPLRWCIGLRP